MVFASVSDLDEVFERGIDAGRSPEAASVAADTCMLHIRLHAAASARSVASSVPLSTSDMYDFAVLRLGFEPLRFALGRTNG